MNKPIIVLLLLTTLGTLPTTGQAQTAADFLAKARHELEMWNPDTAIGYLDQALALSADNAEIWFLRGTAKRDDGDRPGALLDFDQAIALAPNEADYYYERGLLRNYVQDYAGAVADLVHFLALEPVSALVLQMRAEARNGMADYAGAVADYSAAIELQPDDPQLYYQRAFARAEAEDYAGAIEDFTVVMTMEPLPDSYFDKRDAALGRRAGVKLQAGDYDAAIADCELALQRDSHNLEALVIRGMVQTEQGKYAAAIEDFDRVLAVFPAPEVFGYRAAARRKSGDEAGAAEDFKRAGRPSGE